MTQTIAALTTILAIMKTTNNTDIATTIAQGYEAIELAERDATVDIAKHADDVDGARVGLAPDEARAIAAEDPSLIYAVRSR